MSLPGKVIVSKRPEANCNLHASSTFRLCWSVASARFVNQKFPLLPKDSTDGSTCPSQSSNCIVTSRSAPALACLLVIPEQYGASLSPVVKWKEYSAALLSDQSITAPAGMVT